MEQCYNKGCGQKFDLENNPDNACCYHPGVPVFHDALKSWSCCTKRVTDFTAFLEIKGCTVGSHSNVKPPEPAKPAPDTTIIPAPHPVIHKPTVEFIRPDESDPLQVVPSGEITSSLRAAIEQERKRVAEAAQNVSEQSAIDTAQNGSIKIGARCLNKGCNTDYRGEETPSECEHHPGEAIFHEGMKYWSCCQRRTSDFTAFLEQRGCAHGEHRFVAANTGANASSSQNAQPSCRFDWHQTGTLVTISVFAKNAVPERCVVRANHCVCEVTLVYDHGQSTYTSRFRLFGSVEPSASSVRFLQPKVEINLRKKDPLGWKKLEYVEPPKPVPNDADANDSVKLDDI